MAIREREVDGRKEYEVSFNLRSKVRAGVRIQRLRKGVKTLREAQSIEKEMIRECASELAYRENKGVPWVEIIDRFELAHRRDRVGVRQVQKNILTEVIATLRRFTAEWNSIDAQELTPGDVRSVFQTMKDQEYSRSRLRTIKWGINMIFRWGIEEGQIKGVHFSPAQHVIIDMPKDSAPPKILRASEIEKLLVEARAADHEWYPVWFFALNTGMRSGEMYALQWADIDLESKLITVSKSYNNRLGATKSTKAGYWRKIPINRDLEDMLVGLRRFSAGADDFVLPRIPRWKNGDQARFLREFCTQIGITEITFHALRACFATHLLNAGVSSPVVKKICGWTEEKVMGRYIRLAGVDVAGATDRLGFSGVTAEPQNVIDIRNVRVTGKQ